VEKTEEEEREMAKNPSVNWSSRKMVSIIGYRWLCSLKGNGIECRETMWVCFIMHLRVSRGMIFETIFLAFT